jgi:hypothetical protein
MFMVGLLENPGCRCALCVAVRECPIISLLAGQLQLLMGRGFFHIQREQEA